MTRDDEARAWKSYYRLNYPAWWRARAGTLAWSAYDDHLLKLLGARAGDVVLECGIGTGERYALRLAHQGVRLWGIDLAESLLARCAQNGAAGGVDIRLQQGDIEALPYRDASFDRVYSFSSLWYVPNLSTALAEMARVTKPGGVVVFDMLNALHVTPTLARLATWTKRRLGRPAGWWRPRTPMGMARLLRRQGLRFEVQGFGIALPTSLPLVGERANVAGRIPLLHVGLRSSPLRYLGAKLVYVCHPGAPGPGPAEGA